MSNFNSSLGAFGGVLVGDAAGATLEFYKGDITPAIVQNAMRMPGGGVFQVGKGQITDDGELALSLGYALVGMLSFPENRVQKSYNDWFLSGPFDKGGTCSEAFCKKYPGVNAEKLANNEANGALMRVIPIPIWARNEPEATIEEYARQDALLSHPGQVTQDTNVVYSLGVAYLINHPRDYIGCYQYLENFVQRKISSKVRQWFYQASTPIPDAKTNIGHVKWGFQLAIYHLQRGTHYEEAIRDTLLKGGDTDTNAAIVGGMIGALYGIGDIPNYMLNPVLKFDPTRPGAGRPRPEKYRPSNFVKIVTEYFG